MLLIAVVVGGCTAQNNGQGDTTNGDAIEGDGDAMEGDGDLTVGEFTIERSASGYAPNELTVKKGSTVNFTNSSSATHRPASAQHPTHTVYPGSDIQKCGSTAQGIIFDACVGVEPGDSYSFTFNEVGEWFYHDHLNPSNFGKVVVVE